MLNDILNMHELDQKLVVKQALMQLEPKLRFVAYRRFFNNQTLESIAEEIGLSRGRVFQLEKRAMHMLRYGFGTGRM
jgi:RNA polymerase sigma factor (sigma-70 family)